MSKQVRWLQQEVAHWRTEGLVDEALALRILARYPATAERNWGRMIFSAIGAVMVGLGVILFFAYNWHAIPKAAKLALVFGALAAAHGAAMVVARRSDAHHGVVEGLHVLGTMLFGAGIWLVAQIYHIDEHYPNAFLVWSLGALALAWVMPSVVQALLALFLVSFWAGVEVFEFHSPMHAAPLLVVMGVLPLAWWRRSPTLLFCGVAVLYLVTAFTAGWIDHRALLPLLFALGAAALVASMAAPGTAFPAAEGPLRNLGLLVVLGCAYLLSFKESAGWLVRLHAVKPGIEIYLGAAGATLIAAIGLLIRTGLSNINNYRRWQLGLLGAGMAVFLISLFAKGVIDRWLVMVPFNLITLGFAILLILEGSEQLRPKMVGLGCLVFALVVVSRYTDLFSSLLMRAAVFVALGAGLFLVGNFYAKNKKRVQEVQA
jgi:uncharacterized membrane protein